MKYIGIDGCRAGWFFIGLDDDVEATLGIFESINHLSGFIDSASQILIDIPIGLRTRNTRERDCDRLARAVLQPHRGSSVFPAPSRCALQHEDYHRASLNNRDCTGRGLSKQTFNIMAKIRQVDDFLQKEPQSKKIHEMHPEVGFWALNQRQAMSYSKKTEQGFEQRIELLSKYYSAVGELVDQAMQEYPRKLLARDDIVDAMVCAVVARQADSLQRFPPQPEKDEKGLPMEIVYWEP